MAPLPEEVEDLEAFLVKDGLVCLRREEPNPKFFGNWIIEYASANIGVRLTLDRSVWEVEVADVATRPDEWYWAALLRDLFLGRGEDVLSLSEKIAIVTTYWQAIVNAFEPAQRGATHARLHELRREVQKRLFPGVRLPKGLG